MSYCAKTGKVRYNTYDDAHADLIKIKKTPGTNKKPVRIYPCAMCEGYHLTSASGETKVRPAILKHAKAFAKFIDK